MPIYGYQCSSCGAQDDVIQKMSDAPLTTCPACGKGTYAKQISAAGFQLKGDGYYVTDFKNSGNKPAASSNADSGSTPDKDNERFVVTTLRGPSPRTLYQQDYCARGQVENYIKQVKCDLKADRTSASTYLANFARLLLTVAAYTLKGTPRRGSCSMNKECTTDTSGVYSARTC